MTLTETYLYYLRVCLGKITLRSAPRRNESVHATVQSLAADAAALSCAGLGELNKLHGGLPEFYGSV